jgi:hypothetical protein
MTTRKPSASPRKHREGKRERRKQGEGKVKRGNDQKWRYRTQATLIEATSINYDLLPKSSLDVCCNKLITNLRLLMLMNCDSNTVRKRHKHTFANKAWKPRLLNTQYLNGVEYQRNSAKFKIILGIYLSITQVYQFTHLCHFRLVSPIIYYLVHLPLLKVVKWKYDR